MPLEYVEYAIKIGDSLEQECTVFRPDCGIDMDLVQRKLQKCFGVGWSDINRACFGYIISMDIMSM